MDIEELLKEGPSLTLTPEAAPELPAEEKKAEPKVYEEEQYLTEEEKKQVDAFVEQIQLEDSTSILQYGAGTQKKMSDFSEGTLEKVRSKDLGEIGDLLNGVVVELKGFDEEEEKGIVGFFKKKASKAQTLKLRYSKAEGSIDQICEKLEGHQVQLLKDSAMLDQLYDLNKVYFRELTMYILAGKKKLEKETNEVLPALRKKAQETREVRKMHRKLMTERHFVIVLKRRFMIWSLQEWYLYRWLHRFVWYRLVTLQCLRRFSLLL